MNGDPQTMFADGEAYERLMGRWSRKAGEKFIDWWGVPGGLNWLDVGCGNGAFTEEIVARCAPRAVVGIDPSQAQISFARARAATSMAKFETGDAMNLPYTDESFDAAAMALVIAFVPDPPKAVAELKRVVKPGGWVATYMWDLPGLGVPLSPFYKALKDMDLPAAPPPRHEYSKLDVLESAWRAAGFRNVETTVIRIDVVFPDFEDFWDSNTVSVGPHAERVKSLNAAQRDELQARLMKALPAAADGSIGYEAWANAVKGRG